VLDTKLHLCPHNKCNVVHLGSQHFPKLLSPLATVKDELQRNIVYSYSNWGMNRAWILKYSKLKVLYCDKLQSCKFYIAWQYINTQYKLYYGLIPDVKSEMRWRFRYYQNKKGQAFWNCRVAVLILRICAMF
jgi:hypothetical protein